MGFSTPPNYVVYDLRSYFSKQPGDIRLCPICGKDISVFKLPPSKAVTDFLAGAIIPSHEFSVLYKCKDCHWWAVRESWGDREVNDGPDCLIVGDGKSAPDTSQTPDQGDSPWHLTLADKHLYDKVLPLPPTLGRWFTEHRDGT